MLIITCSKNTDGVPAVTCSGVPLVPTTSSPMLTCSQSFEQFAYELSNLNPGACWVWLPSPLLRPTHVLLFPQHCFPLQKPPLRLWKVSRADQPLAALPQPFALQFRAWICPQQAPQSLDGHLRNSGAHLWNDNTPMVQTAISLKVSTGYECSLPGKEGRCVLQQGQAGKDHGPQGITAALQTEARKPTEGS